MSDFQDWDHQLAPVSATTTLGPTGRAGDFITRLIVTPLTVAPGAVSIKDGADPAEQLYAGSAAYDADLKPFVIEVGAKSNTGAWQVVTGANVTVTAVGRFT